MQRRKFIAGLGSLGAAGGAAVGTGAFTGVSADRSVSVEVAKDENAFLAINPGSGPNGKFATTTSDGTLKLEFADSGNDGEGLNTEAVTNIKDVFTIANKGTQEINVNVDGPGAIFDPNDPKKGGVDVVVNVSPKNVNLRVGKEQSYGVELRTKVAELDDDLSGVITISAEAV